MATTISNPASFSSVRFAFFNERYTETYTEIPGEPLPAAPTNLNAYRRGGGFVPDTAAFSAIATGVGEDKLRLSQFSGFTVPSRGTPSISNKTTSALGGGYQSGSASASVGHYFYSDKTYEIQAQAIGLPAYEETTDGDQGFQADWLIGGNASDFSMKWTTGGGAPDVAIIGGVFATPDTYYPLTGSGAVAEFSISVNQFGEGSISDSAGIVISIARTTDLSTVLDTASLNMNVTAIVSDASDPF
jgi:hypothetical protein